MAARTNKSNLKGNFTKENAAEMARRATAKRKQNEAERRVMMDVVKSMITEEDRAAMCAALMEKARKGDEKSITLVLQLLGEMPDAKQVVDVKMQSISDDDRKLLEKVDGRL